MTNSHSDLTSDNQIQRTKITPNAKNHEDLKKEPLATHNEPPVDNQQQNGPELEDKETKKLSSAERQQFILFGKKDQDLIATRVATLILQGEEREVEEALALVREHHDVLRRQVLVKDCLGRMVRGTPLQIAAMAGDVDLKADIQEEKDRGVVERLILAGESELSKDEIIEQLKVITSPEAQAENEKRNNRVLSAIKKFGENLIKTPVKGRNLEAFTLSRDKIAEQLTATTSSEAQQLDSAVHILSALSDAENLLNETDDEENLEVVQARCQGLIKQLEKDLQPDTEEVITSGYIFDSKILHDAAEWFKKNVNRFGGAWCLKSDIFWVNAFGKLESKLSSRDAQVVSMGMGNLNKQMPLRCLNNSDVSYIEKLLKSKEEKSSRDAQITNHADNFYKPHFYYKVQPFLNPSSRLGVNFYLAYYGTISSGTGNSVFDARDMWLRDCKIYIEQKTAALQGLCGVKVAQKSNVARF